MNEPDNPNPYESPQEVAPGSSQLPRRATTLEILLKVFALILFLAAIPVSTFITFFATCVSMAEQLAPVWAQLNPPSGCGPGRRSSALV